MAIVQRAKLEPEDENPRAIIGGNRPPIDEAVVIDLAEALEREGLTKRIDDLIASAGRAPDITSAEIAGRYADLIKQMVTAGKAVEAEREKLNRPLLNAQRALKGRADAIVAPMADAEKTARAKVKKFDDDDRDKEEKRRREAFEAAEAERKRLQLIEEERAAAENRQAETVFAPEPVIESAPPPVVQGDFGAKVVRTTVWRHEIESVRKLPDSILKHEKVIAALNQVIGQQVRSGTREMKGVRIFEEISTTIR